MCAQSADDTDYELSRALAAKPKILLLDEPLNALDDETWEGMIGLLGQIRKATGVTTLHVTHRREEARRLADKVFVLADGCTDGTCGLARAGWDMLGFPGSTQARSFIVDIEPAGGGPPMASSVILSAEAGTRNLDTGNLSGSIPVGTFEGQTVRVVFRWFIPENNTGPAFFQLDHVSVTVTPTGTPPVLYGSSKAGLDAFAQGLGRTSRFARPPTRVNQALRLT